MLDFEGAKQRAINELTKIVSVNSMDKTERKDAGLQNYSASWRISTEVFIQGDIAKPIDLLTVFPDDFPLALPRFYVSKKDREWIGFIPHVDVAGYICLFDEESIIIDSDHPDAVVKACLTKALQTIEQGIKGENGDDFSDEFVAYWNEKYDDKDEINLGLMMLEQVPDKVPCSIKFLKLGSNFSFYHTILHDEGKFFLRFKNYLHDQGYSTTEKEGLYIGSTKDLYPPFNFTNADTYQIVKNYFPQSLKEFERYINRTTESCLIVFSVVSGNSDLFFGWYITRLNTIRNGFRKGTLTPLNIFTSFQKSDRVIRMQFDTYTKARLEKRTDGIESTAQYKIIFAGIGSIGSNLLPFLMPAGIDSLHLIDPETLSLANINRHLLGPDDIGTSKVEGVCNYLRRSNPLIDISIHQESVVNFIRNNIETVNQSDYLFIVVGKNAIENYILQALHENQITVPTFFIWIEPYLVGGHCLFVQPGHSLHYSDFYVDHLFKYNVVDASEYKNPNKRILLREAGCQGAYMPYGQKNITLFLASFVPHLFQIIEGKDRRNLALTWRGKISDNVSLKLSDYGNELEEGNIHLNEL
jgi:hypothetical protein